MLYLEHGRRPALDHARRRADGHTSQVNVDVAGMKSLLLALHLHVMSDVDNVPRHIGTDQRT